MPLPADLPFSRTTVDGVPVFWKHEPGPITAQLMFRVGRADEPTAMAGITHMVQHLALAGLGAQSYEFASGVDHLVAVFTVVGSDDEIIAFFRHVTQALSNLQYDSLEVERTVLEVESTSDALGPVELLSAYRYGVMGLGASVLQDFGFRNATTTDIENHRRRFFHRRNAALWMTGPPSAALRLHLPDGAPVDPPPVNAVEQPLPVSCPGLEGGLAVSFPLARTSTSTAFLAIARKRLQSVLDERSLDAEVDALYIPLGAHAATGVLLVQSEPHEEHAKALALADTLDSLRDSGITEAELQERKTTVREAWEADGEDNAELLHAAAQNYLVIGESGIMPNVVADMASLSVESVSTAARLAVSEAMVLLLDTSPIQDRYPAIIGDSARIVDGTRYRPNPIARGGEKRDLIVGEEGVTLADRDGSNAITILFAQCVLLQRFDDGVVHLLGRDGNSLLLPPIAWRNGVEALARITEAIPPELQYQGQPDDDEEDDRDARPVPTTPTWRRRLRFVVSYSIIIVIALGNSGLLPWAIATPVAIAAAIALAFVAPTMNRLVGQWHLRRAPKGTLFVTDASILRHDFGDLPDKGTARRFTTRWSSLNSLGSGRLTVTEAALRWQPKSWNPVASTLTIPVEAISDVTIEPVSVPAGGADVTLTLSRGRQLSMICNDIEGVQRVMNQLRPLFASAYVESEALWSGGAVRPQLSSFGRWGVPAVWIATMIGIANPVDIAQAESYPVLIDVLEGASFGGFLLAMVMLVMRMRIGLYVSAFAAAGFFGVGIYDWTYAPGASGYEIAAAIVTGIATAIGWRSPPPPAA